MRTMPYLCALAVGLALMLSCAASLSPILSSADASARCTEDMPCWTWSTMGNRSRGVFLIDGRRMVVGPCKYSILRRAGLISDRTPNLRGDATAMRRGCAR